MKAKQLISHKPPKVLSQKGVEKPNVFHYFNFRDFLKDYYHYRKSTSRSFSFSVFSRLAGIQSPNYLKLVMDGTRNLTPANITRFAKALGLTAEESKFWDLLVSFGQSKTEQQKKIYFEQLIKLVPDNEIEGRKRVRDLQDEWEFVSSWHHAAVRELVLFKTFREDPEWISAKLRHRITAGQAEQSLHLLEKLGFLIRDSSGALVQAERNVRYVSSMPLRNLAIQNFHISATKLALSSIENDPVNENDFSCIMIGVKQEQIPALLEQIAQFRKDLNKKFSTETTAEHVLQINFQVIPVTDARV